MSSEMLESGINRRRFLKASVAVAATATVAGAGATLLRDKKPPTIVSPRPQRFQQPVQLTAESNQEAEELFSRLASAEAENVRLQSQLNSAKRRLESKQSTISTNNRSETESLLSQLDDMSLQVGVLSGLIALYNHLDDIELDEIVSDGLATVETALDDLVDSVPTISEGIEMGQAALDELEEHIPVLEASRAWLDDQLDNVDAYYGVVERTLSRVVESSGSIVNLLDEWFQGILKWLPFGIGRKAAEVVQAISELTAAIPDTLAGINENVVRPLEVLLEKKDGQTAIQKNVIAPVRERALEPAALAMENTETLKTTYTRHLAAPARWKIERKQAVRRSIDEYRQTHRL